MGKGKGDSESLLKTMKRKGNLTSRRVEDAIRRIPRHKFVPEGLEEEAYSDSPLPIGYDQTVSQPSVVAKMTELLDPQKGQSILEIGTGSGWQAAILGTLVGEDGKVFTVERIEELSRMARENLASVDLDNVYVVNGDGSVGLKEHAPYDRILCTAASPRIQEDWLEQLKVGGRIVSPVGSGFVQSMVVVEKTGKGETETLRNERGYRFVKLKGEKGL